MPRAARLAPQDLALLRLPSDALLSPDGRAVVYVESRVDRDHDTYRRALRRVDLDSGRIVNWTDGTHADRAPTWTPDSQSVVFVSDRGGASGLWRIHRDAREAQPLVRLPGRLRAPRVSPDGRRIAFLYTPPGTVGKARGVGTANRAPGASAWRIVRHGFKNDGVGFRDGAYTHVWILDTGRRHPRQLTSGDWDDLAFDWSPDGRRIVFVSNRIPQADIKTQNSDLHVVSVRGGRARALTRFRGPKHSPAWSPDGRWIAYAGHGGFPDAVEPVHVFVVPATGGTSRDLMPGSELDCSDTLLTDLEDVSDTPPPPVWSPAGDRLFAVASRDGATNVWEVPLRGRELRQRTFGRHGIRGLSQSRDGHRWAFIRRDATDPGDVWLATAQTRAAAAPAREAGATPTAQMLPGARVQRLSRLGDALRTARRVLAPEPFQIPCPAGHTLHGWILRAPRAPRRGPLVLMIHGGPYAMYGWSFMHEFQVLAQHGYHVAYVNLRGSTGYGRAFMRALVGTWGSRDFEDVMRVADVLERLPFVDKRRIAIAGGSYGGYLTAWTIAHTRRFAAAVAMRGVYDLPSMFGTSDSGPELLTEFEGQAPWESIDRWWRVSPVAHAAAIRTPLLLVHAENDHRCPVSQAEEMFTALRVLERDVELVRFGGEGHGLSRSGRPQNRVERLHILLEWLGRKL